MDTMLVAKVLGVYLMVSGVFVILQKKTLAKVLEDLFAHRAITYLVGLILLLGGLSLVLAGNAGTPLIIKILSWAILLKGAAYIFAPEWLHALTKSISLKSYSLMGLLTGVVGAYLYFFL
jgi:hypothetical protein